MIQPSTGKLSLKLSGPLGQFLGINHELPKVKDFLQWHEVAWTIICKLIDQGRIYDEMESLYLYEETCHAKLVPLLQDMELALILPDYCTNPRSGESVYGRTPTRTRSNLPANANQDVADAVVGNVNDALEEIRRRTENLRRDIERLRAQRARAMAERDEARAEFEQLQRLRARAANGNNDIGNDPNHNNNDDEEEEADGGHLRVIRARLAAFRNRNNGNPNGHDVPNNNNNNGNANANFAAPADAAAVRVPRVPPPIPRRQRFVNNNDVNNNNNNNGNGNMPVNPNNIRQLQPSPEPPSPKTFLARGKCSSLQWSAYYRTEVRDAVRNRNPGIALQLDRFLPNIDFPRDPPPVAGDEIILPWEINIPITNTLRANFQVYRCVVPPDDED
jgi:hypothetical protein